MSFICDENFIEAAVALLEAFDKKNIIRWGPDIFGRGALDTDWVPKAAAMNPKPIIISAEGVQLKNGVERGNLREGGLTYVYLAPGWSNTPWNDYAWKIIKAWPGIVREVSRIRQPTIFEVSVSGLKMEKKYLTRSL